MRFLSPALLSAFLASGPAAAFAADPAETNRPPAFELIRDLIRSNLTGVTDAELDRAAIDGLLQALRGQVVLVEKPAAKKPPALPLLAKTAVFDESFLYARVGNVAAGLAPKLAAALKSAGAGTAFRGLVLDLRHAAGTDYNAAAKAADLFLAGETVLLKWGRTTARSTAKQDAISFPVIILVNGGTAGAAEALAAVLRKTGAGLLIGSRTEGQARVFKELALPDGRRLRIAADTVRLSDDQPLAADGLAPDIQVTVTPEDERAYLADAYTIFERERAPLAAAGADAATNQPRRRLNEAELVRMQREGQDPETAPAPAAADALPRQVRDPALARALDLLKGLAIVQPPR